ncbi:MAG: alanine racemase [Chloroflexi bacterium]|nr:alanine racemase [Chloroflexota bacterium]
MIDLEDILQATGGRVVGPAFARHFPDFCYDSRSVHPGELFLAVKTEKGDGHDYIEEACRSGAAGVLSQRELDLSPYRATCVVVADTQLALSQWAAHVLRKYGVEVVGVTGSMGKTTAKEAIAAVLEARMPVFKNYANYNGRFGLPIALGRLKLEQRLAVLEMACDSFHEIEDLAKLTGPRVGVVMSVGPAHLEYFGSLENIALEKGRLLEALPGAPRGYALLNADDELVHTMATRTRAQVITFGSVEGADLRASAVEVDRQGTRFVFDHRGQRYEVRLRLLGRHNIYPALAAIGVGIVYGVPVREAIQRLAELSPLPGRLNPLEGVQGCTLLDDSYSANPASMLAALEVLEQLDGGRKFAVLGDMAELGSWEEEGHRQVGRRAAEVVDELTTLGERARWIAQEAIRHGLPGERVGVTYRAEDAARRVAERVLTGDIILVKGSAEARLERLAELLLADRAQAESVLVRQEPGWKEVQVVAPDRPTWLEIDLGAIANNLRRIAQMVGPHVKILAVMKADAYGHGAVRVAHTVLQNGASMLGVASLSEAMVLRRAQINAPILIMGYTPARQARQALLQRATVTIFSREVAHALSKAAQALNTEARVHIKVDTGLGRLGLLPQEVLPFAREVAQVPGIVIEGIFTHFAVADNEDARSIAGWGREYTLQQIATFQEVLSQLVQAGFEIPLAHAANSAAIFAYPQSYFDIVRAGIALYGLDPSPQVRCPEGFRPALTFKTQVAQVKELPTGEYISYGSTYRTERPARIAVLPVGYADGFRRAPHHWGQVLIRGRRAPIVGLVTMDQTIAEVTDIPGVRQGDEVVLIGRQGEEEITVAQVAQRLGTNTYEVVSEILARVPRIS